MSKGPHACRPYVETSRELERLRETWLIDTSEADPRRGEIRLAAEVALHVITARDVPSFAHERAYQTLVVLAQR